MDKMDREQMRNMRWLYDDEASYQKAMRRIRLEQLKEERDKEALRAERRRQLDDIKLASAAKAARYSRSLAGRLARLRRWQVERYPITRRRAIVGGAALGALVVASIGWGALHSSALHPKKAQLGAVTGAKASAKAPFQSAVETPSSNSSNAAKYYSDKKVLAFPDTIGKTKVVVSQQELPKEFVQDGRKFDEFLDKVLPKRQSLFFSGGTAYMALDDKGKVQFCVFTTPHVLAFVRAEQALDINTWQDYFSGLTLN